MFLYKASQAEWYRTVNTTQVWQVRWLDFKSKPIGCCEIKMGFPHNNCGGFCIKGGHSSFALLLKQMPDRYAFHEQKEREFRERTGKNVSILRDRSNGETKPLTLQELRERIESGNSVSAFDWGSCSCFAETGDA